MEPNVDLRISHLDEKVRLQLSELEKRLEQRHESSQQALRIALSALEARLAALNELRGLVADQRASFASKVEVELRMGALEKEIAALTVKFDTGATRSTALTSAWGYVIALITIIIGGAAFIVNNWK